MDPAELMQGQVAQWGPSCCAFRPYLSPSLTDQEISRDRRHLQPLIVDLPIVVKLTKEIVKTYQGCNASFTYSDVLNPKRYLTNPSAPASNGGLDNENSDLILAVNGVLVNGDTNHRYIIKDLLGQGTFGQVAKCWASEFNSFVAVKIIKNQPAYRQQAIVEISILNMLNEKYDPEDKNHILRIFEHFIYKEHLCIVFEMLGLNLFELLKVNNFKGISLNLIRSFTKQILMALTVLREASVIHCDLKPENILLTTRLASAELKLIDFGSACREYRTVYSYIQSRFYRSPEVVLGHEYTTAIDMWSVGCVAAELFLGLPLFPAQSQYDLLQRMIRILGGRPPDYILKNARNTSKYFKHAGASSRHTGNLEGQRSAYQFLSAEDYELREKVKPVLGKHYFPEDWDLEQIIMNYHMKKSMSPEEIEGECQKRIVFMDFIKGLVNFDPLKRWTPGQAAQHPFVTQRPYTGPFQPPMEAPRVPVHQGMTVDHNPVSGHWLGAGLSPQVSSKAPYFGSPHYHGHPFSYGSSYGSAGSHGSFGDGSVGLGNSFGNYGNPPGGFVNHRPPAAIVNPTFGINPETWHRMNQVPASQGLGHAHLGVSPSSNFIPMSLGVSPSNFTPPSSHFQHSPGSPSTGSPGRYGPTSPARSSGGGGSALGKAAALGQFNKRRGWGSPGSAVNANSGGRSGGTESSNLSSHGVHQNTYAGNIETIPSSYIEGNSPLGSPHSFPHHGSQFRPRNEVVSGPMLAQTQTFELSTYPIGSLGALMSKTKPTSSGGEDPSSPPNPGDWDANYSEELIFESDGGEMVAGSIPAFSSPSGVGPSNTQGLGVLVMEDFSGRVHGSNATSQDGPQTSVLRQGSNFPIYIEGSPQPFYGYGWVARPPQYHPSQQISPSRLGQQVLQQQQYQYPSFNLHLHEQLSHSVSLMQNNFQGQMNGSLIGASSHLSSRQDRR
eukprot:c20927_g1_i1 orf=110-2953(-)